MGTIVVTNTNDSGPGSLRNAAADSTNVTLKNLIIANGTGKSQDESTESAGQDRLTGEGYSDSNDSSESATGVRPIFVNTPIPFPATNPSPAFNDFIDGKDDLIIGSSVSSAGDVNGDGKDDLIIGTGPSISANVHFILDLTGNGLFSSQPVESGGISPLANQSITLTSGASPVEVSLLLPAVQSAREAARFSGGSSSDGAWASR